MSSPFSQLKRGEGKLLGSPREHGHVARPAPCTPEAAPERKARAVVPRESCVPGAPPLPSQGVATRARPAGASGWEHRSRPEMRPKPSLAEAVGNGRCERGRRTARSPVPPVGWGNESGGEGGQGTPEMVFRNIRSGTFTLKRISSKKESKAPTAPAHVTGAPSPPAAPALPSPAAPPRRRGLAAPRSPLRVCPPRAPGPPPSPPPPSPPPPLRPPPGPRRRAPPRREPSAWPPWAAAGAWPGAPRASASSRLAARQARGRGRRAPGRGLTVPTSDTHHARPPRRRWPGSAILRLRAPHPPPSGRPRPVRRRAPAGARRLPSLRLLRSASSCTSTPAAERRGAPLRPRARARARGGGRSARAAAGGGDAPRPRLLLSRECTCTAGERRGWPGASGALRCCPRGLGAVCCFGFCIVLRCKNEERAAAAVTPGRDLL